VNEILHRVENAGVEKDLLAVVSWRNGLTFTDANRPLALRIRAGVVERGACTRIGEWLSRGLLAAKEELVSELRVAKLDDLMEQLLNLGVDDAARFGRGGVACLRRPVP